MTGWLAILGGIIWLSTMGIAIMKTEHSTLQAYRLQAIMEAILAGWLAVSDHDPYLWISVALIIPIKLVVISSLMRRNFPRIERNYSFQSPFGLSALVLVAVLLSAGGILLGRLGGLPNPTLSGLLIASTLVAFVHLSSRYEIWSMLWAILSLDTIAGSGVLLWGRGLSEVTDVAINLTTLALALVLTYVGGRIAQVKNTVDVRELEELQG